MTNPLISARDAFARAHAEVRATLNGRDWGVTDTGAGPALLLLPGTLGRGDIFWQQIGSLRDLRVIAVSYPGSGGLADWVRDLTALLDARGVTQTAVLGSSLGGYVAQYLAAVQPGRVSHLFAANTLASTQGIDARPPYSLDLWTTPIDEVRQGFGRAMQAWGQVHPEQGDLVDLLLAEASGRVPEAEMRARLDALKTAPALPAPTLPASACTVIESADDPLIPPPLQAGVRDRLAGAGVFRFAWGGHFPYVVRPDLYTGLIRARMGLAPMPDVWRGGQA